METETVKTVKHTPLPWISIENKKQHMFSVQSEIPTEQQVAEEDCSIAGLWYGNEAEAKANAEFIVRACNSHYELLEALKKLYMDVYGGNSSSLEDAMNRAHKDDPFEQEIIAVLKKSNLLTK